MDRSSSNGPPVAQPLAAYKHQATPNKNRKKFNQNTKLKTISDENSYPSASNSSRKKETDSINPRNRVQLNPPPIVKTIPCVPQTSNHLALQIRKYIWDSTPSQTLLLDRARLINGLSHIINHSKLLARPPGAEPYRLQVFGSISFGLDSINSDLDICIMDPERPQGLRENDTNLKLLPSVYNVRKLGQVLKEYAIFYEITPIPTARTPIVKFYSCSHQDSHIRKISIDLNCNNLLGCRNSKLIACYSDISANKSSNCNLFKSLAFIIKLWAKSRGCCDPSGQHGPMSASSYTLVLLLIAYLQLINHLPNLQDPNYLSGQFDPRNLIYVLKPSPFSNKHPKMNPRASNHQPSSASTNDGKITNKNNKSKNQSSYKKNVLVGIDTSFVDSPPSRFNWKQSYATHHHENNPQKLNQILVEALIGFFEFYNTFDFDNYLISIRDGQPLKRDHQQPQSLRSSTSTSKEKDDKRKEIRPVGYVEQTRNKEADLASPNLASLRESLMRYPRNKVEMEKKKEEDKTRTTHAAPVGSGKNQASAEFLPTGSKALPTSSDFSAPSYNSPDSGILVLDFNELDESPSPQNFNRVPTVLSWPHPMVVVDPFVYDRNTSGNIKIATLDRIRNEFTRALRILKSGGSLYDFCSPLTS